jgi:hypothetical protein
MAAIPGLAAATMEKLDQVDLVEQVPPQKEVILNQNEPAPYEGVEIPENIYRSIHVDAFSKDDFQKELQKCGAERADLLKKDENNPRWFYFISGTGIGLLAAILLIHTH